MKNILIFLKMQPASPISPQASGYLSDSFLSVTLDSRFHSGKFGTATEPSLRRPTPSPRSRRILNQNAPNTNTTPNLNYQNNTTTNSNYSNYDTLDTIGLGLGPGPATPNSSDHASHAQRCLQKWLRDFNLETVASSDLAQYLHEKLNIALAESESLGRPNEYETAVCCHLLEVVTKTFGRYSQLVEQLKVEIYSAIYVDKDVLLSSLLNQNGNSNNNNNSGGTIDASLFFQREPYFRKTKDLKLQKEELQKDIEVATRQRNKLSAELLKKKKVLNSTAFRWQRTLKQQSFGMWAKVVQTRRNQRILLMQYFLNRDKARLRLVLRNWKLSTDEAKRNKAKQLLDESRERVSELEETRNILDKERKDTELKMAELRHKLDAARKELSELDSASLRVQQQLAESKEEELRSASCAWAELCDISASSQLAALQCDLLGECFAVAKR
jgi:hypothetical protein